MLRRIYEFLLNKSVILKIYLSELQALVVFLLLGKEKRNILRENKNFKDRYKGKRCFVVGNGPSLNQQDLSLLENEYVFTVNELMRHKEFGKLKSNFHVLADPFYYKKGYEEKIQKMMSIIEKEENIPEVFFPVQGKEIIEELKFQNIKFHYFLVGCNMYEPYKKKFNYAKSVPGFYTVVQYAITLAIYMGFSEIYLLGCDMTGYRKMEDKVLGKGEENHCYKVSEEERKKLYKDENVSCEAFFSGYAQMFKDYRRLLEYTKREGIRLVNVTEGGMLDSLPREKFESLFSTMER